MKYTTLILLFSGLIITSCHHTAEQNPADIKPVATVDYTTIATRPMEEQTKLIATSVYLKRSQVIAPIAGFITHVYTKYGDAVQKGQVLFEIETKERSAIGNDGLSGDNMLNNFGKISIKAPTSGMVTIIDRQQIGEYVMEGNPLCTIVQNNDLAFQLNMPYEFHNSAERNRNCLLVLPDGSKLNATIVKPLTTLNAIDQTQAYLLKPSKNIFLPEGLVASVLLTTNSRQHAQVLPKTAVLSDALLQHFWVMKLANDTTAIKLPVMIGMRNKDNVEIISPAFSSTDRILTEGNYGLSDTALVKIKKR